MSPAEAKVAGTRGPIASWRRLQAMVLRYVYLYRGSWPRLLELTYWPTLQMVMWGFLTIFLASKSGFFVQAGGVLIAAVLLWDVLFRSSLGVSLSFLEEMWSRNLGHIGVIPAALLAIWLYEYSVFDMGLPLIAFFTNLQVMGWSFGLIVCGLLMRYGLGAESIAWFAIFAIAPFSAIYYPLSVMPDWLQWIAGILPSTHVFEGMRSVLIDKTFRTDLLFNAVALNAVYLTVAVAVFLRFFRSARERGLILQIGE